MAPKKEDDAAEEVDSNEVAQFDLTRRMAPFLDKHLLLNLLVFLKKAGGDIYKERDLLEAEKNVALSTNMIDCAKDCYESLGEDVPAELDERCESVLNEVKEASENSLSLLSILEDQGKMDDIRDCKDFVGVCEKLDISMEEAEALVSLAKLKYEIGDYGFTALLLTKYRYLRIRTKEDETSRTVGTLWGSIASQLLNNDFEAAADNIDTLTGYLENAKLTRKELLVQKTWLLHWSCWAMFRPATVPSKVLNIFVNEKSLSIISLSCPHLFRYVAASLVLQKRLKLAVKDTVAIINAESHAYSDPITRFLVALNIDLDFDRAQEELKQCENVCKIDSFLADQWSEFEENARLMIFEMYCHIHQSIYIDMIAKNLNMSTTEAELWIVKLIQSAKLDARIDSEKSRVVMSKTPPSVYQQVIEKTKNLSFRSTMLLSNLEKKEQKDKV
jgi:translation initiation factor 3 subunit E